MPEPGEPITVDQVRDMLANPIYAGVAAPALIDEETWVKSAVLLMEEIGQKPFLRTMLRVLRTHLGGEPMEKNTPPAGEKEST